MREHRGSLDGTDLRVVIVASRFNERVVGSLVQGALDALRRVGVHDDDVQLAWVPGAFELPVAAAVAARAGWADAVVGLGAVVRGETPHFDLVAGQAAAGLARVGLDTGVPVLFGVLTTDDAAQAEARAGGKAGNKGADAALAAVETVRVLRSLRKRDGDEGTGGGQ
jgi:6,7-dimethyl-8-ribityllumazine synthase